MAESGTTMQASARAHVNIALAKYWGKASTERNVPAVASLSASIEDLWTEVDVVFDASVPRDSLVIDGVSALDKEVTRLTSFFDMLRRETRVEHRAAVTSRTNFPRSAGLASSASAFAALSMAGCAALGLDKTSSELSVIARIGSGSAARSVLDGYVQILAGEQSELGASRVATADHLPLDVAIVLASGAEKSVSSRVAMERCRTTSPYYAGWVESSRRDFQDIREAVLNKDFLRLAETSERNCMAMHATTLAANPPIVYWNRTTMAAIHLVRGLRDAGAKCFFTIDAGPNVVVFYQPEDGPVVLPALGELGCELRVTRVGGVPSVSRTS